MKLPVVVPPAVLIPVPTTRTADSILGQRAVCVVTGLSKTTIWRMARAGTFPHRRQLSPGRVGWLASEVDEWMASRVVAP